MSQIGDTFGVTGTNLFMFMFGNPDQNDSEVPAHAKQHSTRNSVSGAVRLHPQPLLVLFLRLNAS